eukprot:16080-Heterococcus_DN1.PRE.1
MQFVRSAACKDSPRRLLVRVSSLYSHPCLQTLEGDLHGKSNRGVDDEHVSALCNMRTPLWSAVRFFSDAKQLPAVIPAMERDNALYYAALIAAN